MNEDDVMHRPSERVHSRAAKPRLHLIYFALAAFDLMAVLLGLFLIDRLSALHMESIHVTEVWGHRLDDYVDLMRMAAAVNAPGNDIFNSRDLEAESKHLATSHAAFDLRAGELRQELARSADRQQVSTLLAQFDAIESSMDRMVSQAQAIFEQFRQHNLEQAGANMALMDREYVGLIAELGKLGVIVRTLQQHQFDRQIAAATRWQRLEYIVAGLIVVMVAGVALYGLTLTRRLKEAAAQTQRHLTALAQSEAELQLHRQNLQDLVHERTKQLESSHAQLRQADRLAAIGTLAAGLGHDMNNVLLPVRARLDALDATELTAQAREQFTAIRRSISYLQQLSDGLHLLALDPEDPDASAGRTDLAHWWAQVGTLLVKAVPKRVIFESDIPAGLPQVAVAPHRLTQAMLNLVVNAGEAIPDRGTVRVWVLASPDQRSIRVGVTDTGEGMSPEVRKQAMDPFFTTKKRGLGTGLGLSLVHGVATSARGSVTIESEPGRGTTIVLTLPALGPRLGEGSHPESQEDRNVAISIADRRAASFISALVQSSGFVPHYTNDDGSTAEGEPQECRIWITQPPTTSAPGPGMLSSARRFMRADRRRRIVVFGPVTDEWLELGASSIPDIQDIDTIRRVIGEALRAVSTSEVSSNVSSA